MRCLKDQAHKSNYKISSSPSFLRFLPTYYLNQLVSFELAQASRSYNRHRHNTLPPSSPLRLSPAPAFEQTAAGTETAHNSIPTVTALSTTLMNVTFSTLNISENIPLVTRTVTAYGTFCPSSTKFTESTKTCNVNWEGWATVKMHCQDDFMTGV
ncbi:unnamed protein product [Diplocarpon coronariae]